MIASIEDPAVIAKILGHVATREAPVGSAGIWLGRRGWRLDATPSALRHSSGFAGICGPVAVRLPAPSSSRGVAGGAADWQIRGTGVLNCRFPARPYHCA